MKKHLLFKLLGVFAMLFAFSVSANAGSKMTATAKGPTGAGTVYVSKTDDSNGTYKESAEASSDATSGSQKYYLWHKAHEDATFHGWYTDDKCTSLKNANDYDEDVTNNPRKIGGSANAQNRYAKFTFKYYSKMSATAVGNGTVSVNSTNSAGTSSELVQNSDDSMNASETQTYYLFAQANEGNEFVGWFADEECTTPFEMSGNSYQITTNKTNAASAETVNVYAKFRQLLSSISFNVKADPSKITSVLGGGTDQLGETLSYSVAGVSNTSNAGTTSYFLNVTCVDGYGYSVKLYDGNTYVSTITASAAGTRTFEIESEQLNGKTVVIETMAAWPFTVKVNTIGLLTITGGSTAYEETLTASVAGTLNASSYAGDEYNVKISGPTAVYSVVVKNQAGQIVSTPVTYKKGEQTFTVNKSDLVNGTIEVTATDLGANGKFFIMKANPDHFSILQFRDGSNGTYINLKEGDNRVSEEGTVIIYSDAQAYFNVKVDSKYTYTLTRTYGNNNSSSPYNDSQAELTNYYLSGTNLNGGSVVISTSEIMTEDWTYTIIANPAHVKVEELTLKDNGNPIVIFDENSGNSYTSSKNNKNTHPRVTPIAPRVKYSAYFFPASVTNVDKNTDKSLAVAYINETGAAQQMNKAIVNSTANGGTLFIDSYQEAENQMVNVIVHYNPTTVYKDKNNNTVTLAQDVEVYVGSDPDPITKTLVSTETIDEDNAVATYTIPIPTTTGLSFSRCDHRNSFYKITHEGTILEESSASHSESGDPYKGDITYSFAASNVKNGDNIEIFYHFPKGPFAVTVNVKDEEGNVQNGFVKSVTVDDVAQSDWQNGILVDGGSTVKVYGDAYNYVVIGKYINDAYKTPIENADKAIDEATEFKFVVSPIVREGTKKHYTFSYGQYAGSGEVRTNLGGKYNFAGGENLEFCDSDNPMTFSAASNDSNGSKINAKWTANGIVVGGGNDCTLSVPDGATINVEYASSTTTTYAVTFTLKDDLEVLPDIVASKSGNTLQVLSNMSFEKDVTLTIQSNASTNVTSVKVGGVPLSDSNGVYTISSVNKDMDVEIYGGAIVPTYDVTYTVNGSNDLTLFPTVKLDGNAVAANHVAEKNSVVTIESNDNFNVTGVKANGADVTANAAGVYSVTVTDNVAIAITGEEIKTSFTIIVHGEGDYLVAGDDYFWAMYNFEEGATEVELSELEDGEGYIMFNPLQGSGYGISSIKYNNQEYYKVVTEDVINDGGDTKGYNESNRAYYFRPAGGDVFEITVSELNRNKVLNLYVFGVAKAANTKVSDYMEGTLATQFVDGKNTVNFCDDDLPLQFSFTCSDSNDKAYKYYNYNNVETTDNTLYAEDGDVLVVEFNGKTSESVKLGATGMYSFVSRHALTFAENADVKAYKATECADGKIEMERVTGNIAAGTGLMLKGENGTMVQIPHAASGSEVSGNIFTGVYMGNVIPGSDSEYTYVFGTVKGETGFWQLNGDKVCDNGNHAYLRCVDDLVVSTGSAKCLSLVFSENEATGIKGVSENVDGSNVVYNLAGQRVNKAAKGILIKNGKKIVVK